MTTTINNNNHNNNNNNNYIEVPMTLSVDDKTRHWWYFGGERTEEEIAASPHKTAMGGTKVERTMKVHNGRNNAEDLTLHDSSFELVTNCPTQLSTEDFYKIQNGDEQIKTKYYTEVAEFVKQKVGCDKVIVINHRVRNASKKGSNGGIGGYATGEPHTDSSPVSADETALKTLEKIGDDKNMYGRYAYINLWRNINGDNPIENNHLALLDERTTIKPDDYICKDATDVSGYFKNASFVQFGLNARHANIHKWYYFPRMTKNECILLKNMDSDAIGVKSRIAFHLAIEDPTAANKNNVPQRESIETRIMCYWKKENCTYDSMPKAAIKKSTMDPQE